MVVELAFYIFCAYGAFSALRWIYHWHLKLKGIPVRKRSKRKGYNYADPYNDPMSPEYSLHDSSDPLDPSNTHLHND